MRQVTQWYRDFFQKLAQLMKVYPAFYEMKFEVSLPYKQEPTTGPYPEPD